MAPFTSRLLVLLLLLPLLLWAPTLASAKWQTLSGQAPVVIASGGTSGLYPDQTYPAYMDALTYSLPGVVITCDLQIAKSLEPRFLTSGTGICRTGLDLANSTVIATNAPQFNSTYIIDGQNHTGFFAFDIPFENLTILARASQSNPVRTPAYDGQFLIQKPEFLLPSFVNTTPGSTWWLNSEYTTFIEANSKFNATLLLEELIQTYPPGYVSVPEISLLKKIQAAASSSGTKLIYKFLDAASMDTSTNQTYDELLQNLTYIKTLASGILVPKSYIWQTDSNLHLLPPTTLVEDAHKVNLEVYAYDFANDQYPNSYNFSFGPVTEILYYIENYNFSVDGIFTDFPTTASEAISCYASNSRNDSVQNKDAIIQKQKVISHNGDSGNYPGASIAAYNSAILAGVDYIDCIVQISQDSVPFCGNSINLVDTTIVSQALFQTYQAKYPGVNQGLQGVYSFDLTWDLISTLHSKIFSPEDGLDRDDSHDGNFTIISLADFLAIAKNNSKGALIDIENAVYLRDQQNLAVVDVVADTLSQAGYNSTDDVILQSDDSSVLARLRDLNVTYPLMYMVAWPPHDDAAAVSLNANDFVEIKQYASSINLYERLVEPYDGNFFLKGPPTDLITLAHDQNLTAYYQLHRNEYLSYAFDLKADPTLQLFSLAFYGIDGFVTDFPATVVNYLGNQCFGNGLTSSTVNFTIPLVVPGVLGDNTFVILPPTPGPSPNLVVPQSPLSGVPLEITPGPAPASMPASASRVSMSLLLAVLSAVLNLLAMV